ncbi:hypothetical protein ATE62_04605 [Sphingopyxis sp. HIX]|nr:hypothetical protein ATE62_04605 [Sphingopyxis sp. HIX]KTE85174.1 hypothetical protein ATE72_04760 [Sphingopyxis sp. HXXIV]
MPNSISVERRNGRRAPRASSAWSIVAKCRMPLAATSAVSRLTVASKPCALGSFQPFRIDNDLIYADLPEAAA